MTASEFFLPHESDWKSLVDNAPDLILILDRSGNTLYINRVIYSASIEEARAKSAFDQSAPEFHQLVREKLIAVFERGAEVSFEVRRAQASSVHEWWSISAGPIRREGAIVACLAICRDVSNLRSIRAAQEQTIRELREKFFLESSAHEKLRDVLEEEIAIRLKTEAALRISEERYRTVVENSQHAMSIYDGDGQLRFLNSVAATALGGEPREFLGKTMHEIFPAEIADRQLASIRRVMSTGIDEVLERQTQLRGEPHWYLNSLRPILDESGKFSIVLVESINIDAQMQALTDLKQERDFNQTLLDVASVVIVCTDPSGKITSVNSECERVFGFSAGEMIGRLGTDFVYQPKSLEALQEWSQHLHSGRLPVPGILEHDMLSKSGPPRRILWSYTTFQGLDRSGLMAILCGVDVTEQRALAQQLESVEQRNRAVLESLPDMVFLVSADGQFLEFLGSGQDDLMVPVERFLGKSMEDVMPGDLAKRGRQAVEDALKSGEIQSFEYSWSRDEKQRFFESRTIRCGEKECVAVVRDITERKEMEVALARANEALQLEQQSLEDSNKALRVVLEQRSRQAEELKQQVTTSVVKLLAPMIQQLRDRSLPQQQAYIDAIESVLKEITAPFITAEPVESAQLTPRELEICAMIRANLQTKQIAETLALSPRTVEKFRQNIRKKLGLDKRKINLISYLRSATKP